jgi:hypothetical protein
MGDRRQETGDGRMRPEEAAGGSQEEKYTVLPSLVLTPVSAPVS